jgi:hypothetical protein
MASPLDYDEWQSEERYMTWIKVIPPSDADADLKRCYDAVYALYPREYGHTPVSLARPGEDAERIVASHSLIPQALLHSFSTFGALLSPDLPLTRRQHEMIATVVSATNRCFY